MFLIFVHGPKCNRKSSSSVKFEAPFFNLNPLPLMIDNITHILKMSIFGHFKPIKRKMDPLLGNKEGVQKSPKKISVHSKSLQWPVHSPKSKK